MDTREMRKMMEHPHTRSTMTENASWNQAIKDATNVTVLIAIITSMALLMWGSYEIGRYVQRMLDHDRYMEHLESLRNE